MKNLGRFYFIFGTILLATLGNTTNATDEVYKNAGKYSWLSPNRLGQIDASKQNLQSMVINRPDLKRIIQLPPINGYSMMQLPTITTGSRAGQENKIIMKLTKFPEQKVITVNNPDGDGYTMSSYNYALTFYALMKTDKGFYTADKERTGAFLYNGSNVVMIELATVYYYSITGGGIYGYVKENGEFFMHNFMGAKGDNFTAIPSQFSEQEWDNGTALKEIQSGALK